MNTDGGIMKFGKVDWGCIGFMLVIIIIASVYLSIFHGWILVGGNLVWVGWMWVVVIGVTLAVTLLIIWFSRKPAG